MSCLELLMILISLSFFPLICHRMIGPFVMSPRNKMALLNSKNRFAEALMFQMRVPTSFRVNAVPADPFLINYLILNTLTTDSKTVFFLNLLHYPLKYWVPVLLKMLDCILVRWILGH